MLYFTVKGFCWILKIPLLGTLNHSWLQWSVECISFLHELIAVCLIPVNQKASVSLKWKLMRICLVSFCFLNCGVIVTGFGNCWVLADKTFSYGSVLSDVFVWQVFKRHNPSTAEEQEMMENLFDSLCSCLMLSSNRERFLKGEGLQLMNLMLRFVSYVLALSFFHPTPHC